MISNCGLFLSLFWSAINLIENDFNKKQKLAKDLIELIRSKQYLLNIDSNELDNCDEYNKYLNLYKNCFDNSISSALFLQSGRYLNDFEEVIVENHKSSAKLGKGSFGSVYKVINKLDDNYYAIKKIKLKSSLAAKSNQKICIQKLLREIKIWAKLKSDFIVQYKSAWFENSVNSVNDVELGGRRSEPILHIRMELCEMTIRDAFYQINGELNQFASDEITAVRAYIASTLFPDIVKGVNYLHSQTPIIIHRDIKMSNILLTSDWNIKISDFGLTREHNDIDRSGTSASTAYTVGVGCLTYMAPEMMTAKYDEKVDIFSLGVLLRNMFNIDANTCNKWIGCDSVEYKSEIAEHCELSLFDKILSNIFKNMIQLMNANPAIRPTAKQILNNRNRYTFSFDLIRNMLSIKQILSSLNSSLLTHTILRKKLISIKITTLKLFPILREFDSQLLADIKYVFIYEENNQQIILINNKIEKQAFEFRVAENATTRSTKSRIVSEFTDKDISDIICGESHALCLTTSGEVMSWGDNRFGQLGNGTQAHNYEPKIIMQLIDKNIKAISCGALHSIALSEEGKVFGWGYNYFGQLGVGSNCTQFLTPVEITAFNCKIAAISCGAYHCLALTKNSSVFVWGYNMWGQLGDRNDSQNFSHQDIPIPIKLENNIVIIKISCGHNHSLMLSSDGDIYCFGENKCGQLGIGNDDSTSVITKIESSIKFADIGAVFSKNISVGLSELGKCFVWGQCGEEIINFPQETHFESIDETLLHYCKYKITQKAIMFAI